MVEYNVFRMSAEEELSKEDLYSYIMANIHISFFGMTHPFFSLTTAFSFAIEPLLSDSIWIQYTTSIKIFPLI